MPKRKGCPPGGWPSQIAKREARLKALEEQMVVEEDVPWAMDEEVPEKVAQRPDAALFTASKGPQKVVADSSPEEIPATTFSFALQHVGQNLWRVVMLKHVGDKIIERKFVSHGDLKGNALARLRFMVYQLWFNERMPADNSELVPMQPAMHG